MRFKTIREVAATGILPEMCLRRFQREGKLPGFYSGSRFYVDTELLPDVLQRMSTENMALTQKRGEGGQKKDGGKEP